MGIQPILTIKKIKGAARQCYSDDDRVIRCEQFTCLVNVNVFRIVKKWVQYSPLVLFTRNVKKINKHGDVDGRVNEA